MSNPQPKNLGVSLQPPGRARSLRAMRTPSATRVAPPSRAADVDRHAPIADYSPAEPKPSDDIVAVAPTLGQLGAILTVLDELHDGVVRRILRDEGGSLDEFDAGREIIREGIRKWGERRLGG